MDSECRQLRRHSRMLERRFRRTRLATDRLAWVEHERLRHRVYRQKEAAYFNAELTAHVRQPKKLWSTLDAIMGSGKRQPVSGIPTAQAFLDFFNEKVESVRRATESHAAPLTFLPPATVMLDSLQPCSEEEVSKLIMSTASKSCALDPLPTDIMKQFLPQLAPFITKMCNASLTEGSLPVSQRHATVIPRLKKSGADPADVKNYRPISNLTYMSKVVERLVCRQLVAYLNQHGLLPSLQSAYRHGHSTETAVLKVVSDFMAAADRGDVTLLSLLDLSAAFDTVDHSILIDRLHHAFGLRGTVLTWIESFINERSQSVLSSGVYSSRSRVSCGVPQGSVLGPILFLLYTADVLEIARRHGVSAHSYADDTQLYIRTKADLCAAALQQLSTCIAAINDWMCSNRLKLNTDKTQFTCLGTRQQICKIDVSNLPGVDLLPEVTLLGVKIDQQLNFAAHFKYVSGRCFYQLRQLRAVRDMLTADTTKSLVVALVLNRLDYCNGVFAGTSDTVARHFQSVIRAAARLVARRKKFDNISAVIRDELHWLPFRQRVEYKLSVSVYNCLHQTAPSYLAEMCRSVASNPAREILRSASRGDLIVPRTRGVRYGPRSFAIAGPTVWNTLPPTLRDRTITSANFRRQLKTELYRRAYTSTSTLVTASGW